MAGRRRTAMQLATIIGLVSWLAFATSCGDPAGDDSADAGPGTVTAPPMFVTGDEDDDLQTWTREFGDEARGVTVTLRADGTSDVFISVAEFVREEPLESEMRSKVARAIRDVPGVDDVYEEDREMWIVTGDPDGEALLAAVAEVVDELEPRTRRVIEGE